MSAPANHVGAADAFDWSCADLGPPSTWTPLLRLGVEVVLNTPLPMLLIWGPRRVTVFNAAYAAVAGLRPASVPGGTVPAVMPTLITSAPDAYARALAGATLALPQQRLDTLRDGVQTVGEWDLHLTPVADGAGVHGVLVSMAPAAPRVQQASAALRILVVEDNLDSQYLVCEMLKAFGYQADGIGHAEGALTMLAEQAYDVLFSDVSLPGMSGVDLAREALRTRPALKVIFASGYGDALLRHVEFAHQSLQKPYELDDLQAALAQISQELQSRV